MCSTFEREKSENKEIEKRFEIYFQIWRIVFISRLEKVVMEEALPSLMWLLFSLSNIFFHVRSIVPGLCMQTMLSVQINVMYNILQGQTIQNKITLQLFQRKKSTVHLN